MSKKIILLALVVLLGAIFRAYRLDQFPVSLNWDEVSHGYNAYSVLKTGKDEWGRVLPTIFRAFGDYKLPLYVYLTIIPVKIFGLSEVSVRLVSLVAGIAALYGIYLMISNLPVAKRNPYAPLIGSFLLAFLPWHFFISRPALEANLALTLDIFGIGLLLKGLKSPKSMLFGLICLSLSLHTYNTSRVFIPLVFLAFFVLFKKQLIISRELYIGLVIFAASLLLVGLQILSGEGLARYSKLTILSDSAVFQIGEARTNSKLPSIVAKFLYNRPVYFVRHVVDNYIGYYSFDFINQSKGAQSQFAIPNQSLLGLPILILFLIGFAKIYRLSQEKSGLFILGLLFFSPLAAALTNDPPQALRPNPLIIPIIIISSLGFHVIMELSGRFKPQVVSIVLFSVVVNFLFYQKIYYTSYATSQSSSWQYGYKQVFQFLEQFPDQKIFISKKLGEPHIFYAFFNHLDPHVLQDSSISTRFQKSDWYWTDQIGNYYFVNDWQIPNQTTTTSLQLESGSTISTENSILVTSPDHLPLNFEKLFTAYSPKGDEVLIVGRL